MSPEQLDPAGLDVDTRSDVYALGVILYELLVGARPIDTRTAGSLDEVRQRIRTQEPVRPSTRLHAARAMRRRPCGVGRRADVAGLARDAARRSGLDSAEGARKGSQSPLRLASGVRQRHPAAPRHQPVLARPPSATLSRPAGSSRGTGSACAMSCAAALLAHCRLCDSRWRCWPTRLTRERDRANEQASAKRLRLRHS